MNFPSEIAIPNDDSLSIEPVNQSQSFSFQIWKHFISNPIGFTGLGLFILILITAIFGPILSPYSYFDINLSDKNLPPNSLHWFGTDDLGRDMLTRVLVGARISLFIGIAAACIDMFIGMLWGGIAALSGGFIDELMMRIADILYAIPYVLMVILLAVFLGSGFVSILIAMTIIGWITMARIVRGKILQLKEEPFVQASKSLGGSFFWILFKHLLPNAIGPIITTLTLTVPSAIITEAFLSFLGLGIQAPMASWGTMANEGLPAMLYYPWRLLFPSLFISFSMLSFNLMGDALYEAFNEKRAYA